MHYTKLLYENMVKESDVINLQLNIVQCKN